MYTAQFTIERIQSLIKEKGFTQKEVLKQCDINENTLKRMTDNKGMSSFYIAKIADYLDCSVDYLLGRTDNPNLTGGAYINGDNNNNGQQAINGNVTVNSSDDSSDTSDDKQLLDMIKELDIVDRSKIIIQIDKMKNKKTSPMSGAN